MAKKKKVTFKDFKYGPHESSSKYPWDDDLPCDPNQIFYRELQNFGERSTIMDRMHERDPVLSAIWNYLLNYILSFPTSIDGTDEIQEITEYVRHQMNNIKNKSNFFRNLMRAFAIGNSFVEIIYEQGSSGDKYPILLEDLKVWRPDNFFFHKKDGDSDYSIFYSPDGLFGHNGCFSSIGFYMNKFGDNVIELDKKKFKSFAYNAPYDSPIGKGIYDEIYLYFKFTIDAMKWWVLLIEMCNLPKIIISPETGAEFSSTDEVVANEFAKNPSGFKSLYLSTKPAIDYIQSDSKVGDAAQKLIEYLNNAKSIRITGHDMLTNTSNTGSFAKEKITFQIEQHYLEGYIRSVEDFINNQIIKQLVDNLFDTNVYPKFKIENPELIDYESFMNTIKIATELNVAIPEKWIRERLNIPEPGEDEKILEPLSITFGKNTGDSSFSNTGKKNILSLRNDIKEEYRKYKGLIFKEMEAEFKKRIDVFKKDYESITTIEKTNNIQDIEKLIRGRFESKEFELPESTNLFFKLNSNGEINYKKEDIDHIVDSLKKASKIDDGEKNKKKAVNKKSKKTKNNKKSKRAKDEISNK